MVEPGWTIPARENAQAKGRRYLLEGRLRLLRVVPGVGVEAVCRGQGDTYSLGWRDGRWWCACPARSLCAHLVALQLVTVTPTGTEGIESRPARDRARA